MIPFQRIMTQQLFLSIASLLGGLGVILGAFGAHYLKTILDQEMLNVFETGVRYQMYHVFALFAVALTEGSAYSGWAFIVGTVLFSGSLYLLSITGIKWLGMITPIGGVILVIGWLLLFIKLSMSNSIS